jgi:hypothetical protein
MKPKARRAYLILAILSIRLVYVWIDESIDCSGR